MAKLSARGRTELARLSKVREGTETYTDGKESGHDWSKTTVVLMSDRTILRKYEIRFKADGTFLAGKKQSYGWKNLGKAKPTLSVQQFIEAYLKVGYAIEHSTILPTT